MTHGMVSAAQPEAVEAGIETLRAGGNAVDAAVATALVQTAVDPQMCGIAGFGCMHIYAPRAGVHTCLEFYGRAPLAARPDMWAKLLLGQAEDGFGFFIEGRINELGYGAIATPMTLRALNTALERYGTRKLTDLIRLAIPYCEDGFMVRPHVAAYWNQVPTESQAPHTDMLTAIPATRKIYAKPDGSLRGVGEILRNPDMGAAYRRIADAGAEDFYTGEIAARIAADMAAHSALLARADLEACRAEENAPLWGSYRGYRIATAPPPGGGLVLLEMLNILEAFDLRALGHNTPDYIATVAEAMKIGQVDREAHLGDPKFVAVPVEKLSSKAYAAELAARIKRGEKTSVPRIKKKEAADTTQVCVVDAHGTCVSLTHTLGTPSGVVTEGLGFMYNGAMGAFDPRPGRAGSIAPGKARASSMAPSIAFKGDKPFLVVGAPGGSYIVPGILQVILNVIDFGMTALEAISAPRFCATSDTIWLTNRILRSAERELVARGYPVKRSPLNFYFAGVHGIRIVDGKLDGAADPGRDGMAAFA
ncbi:MAG TPA: gamma-glutamyltransferase family protein [Alphaproteobacteria bacterium]|nr:gamma-glutamyltransferase family protein [Alphaproteobacteria bacterium]